jgi:catalase
MGGIPKHIEERQLAHFDKIHPDYGNGVRRALSKADGTQRPAISVTENTPQEAAE